METATRLGRGAMAKKQAKMEPTGPKGTAISIKGSDEWRDWVSVLADHARTDTAKLIDGLLVEYARKHGLPNPPKR